MAAVSPVTATAVGTSVMPPTAAPAEVYDSPLRRELQAAGFPVRYGTISFPDRPGIGYDLPTEIVNVNGGAIALGHPIGASGARIVATLLHELRRREGRFGLATLCLGGGGSVAMALERI